MLDDAMMSLGDQAIYVVIAVGALVCIVVPFVMLVVMKHKGQIELDHYGKYRGTGRASSFVCPDCLHRSYAPSHVARRWCAPCAKSFPEKPKISRPEAQPAE
jgi:hypothetical protein